MASKKSPCRDKKILKLYGEDVSGGSEDHITPEAVWMPKQGFKWTDSKEDVEETIPAVESDEDRDSDYSA